MPYSGPGTGGTGPTFPRPPRNPKAPALDELGEINTLASFPPAFDYLMSFEDPEKLCEIAQDDYGETVSGINSDYWPKQFAKIASMPQSQRLPWVMQFYRDNYWATYNLMLLESQQVANYTMDCLVNPGNGARILQEALDTLGAALDIDGVVGPKTIQAANLMIAQVKTTALLDAMRGIRLAIYKKDAQGSRAKYLAGWTNRANRLGV